MNKEKTIVTVTGITYPISKCKKFDTGYYIVGDVKEKDSGDCYLIDGKHYRFETGQVVFDYETNTYVLKNNTLHFGVVEFKEKEPVFGYFLKTNNNIPVCLKNGSYHLVINLQVIEVEKQYREKLSDGMFYHTSLINASDFNRITTPASEYKTSLPYDSGDVLKQYLKIYDNLEVPLNRNVEKVSNFVEDLSFGLEFETVAGFLPERILNSTGLIPLRDGSISGIEYVTVPMSGAKGLQTVMNASKELDCRTRYDNSCALHLHIGNVPRSKEFILAMFKLTCAIQDEIYTMFPLYKKYNFGVKNKNYSKPFPLFELLSQMDPVVNKGNIDNNFNVLYSYLSMGESFKDQNCDLKNVKSHPADREGRAKWNIRTRYYLHNLIPLIFGNKQTIEFRIHTATFDADKIMLFVLMNSLIVNFTIQNTEAILSNPLFLKKHGNLDSILKKQIFDNKLKDDNFKDYTFQKLHSYLINRKQRTERCNAEGKIIGDENNINVVRKTDWFKIINKSKFKNLEEQESTYLQQKLNLKKSHIDQKKVIIDSHMNGQLSSDRARQQLSQLDSYFESEMIQLKETFKEVIEIQELEEIIPW